MDYALIDNNSMVSNIIWLHPMNASDFPNAIPTNGLPVSIGDMYENGAFYRDGKRIEYPNQIADDIIDLIKDQAILEVQQEVTNNVNN